MKCQTLKRSPKSYVFLKQKLRAFAFRPTGGTLCRKKLVVERSKNNRAKAIVIFTGAKTRLFSEESERRTLKALPLSAGARKLFADFHERRKALIKYLT